MIDATPSPPTSPTKRRGLLLVLSSPSGAGKSSLAQSMIKHESDLHLSISLTTRAQRPGEKDGREYYFVNNEEFHRRREADELLEWAEVFGYYYGTPKAAVERSLDAGCDILFDIDWQGTQQLTQIMRENIVREDIVTIFILPPSLKILEQRLHIRAQDSETQIRNRMQKAENEMSHWGEYDFIIINDKLDKALAQIRAILTAERLRRHRQKGISDFIKSLHC